MTSRQHAAPLILSVILAMSSQSDALTQEQVSSSDSQGISLTIYNQNFGLVRDLRNVDLKDGINYLRFEDVAAQIDPTSVSFQSVTAPNAVVVREQNYQYDLIDPTTILDKSIGKNVKFRRFLPGGQINEVSGTLLNSPRATITDTAGRSSIRYQGLVLKTDQGILLDPSGEAELAELPSGLVSKPSLLWKLESTRAGTHKAEIAYQTSGLNWRCDYVAITNFDDTKLDMTSWVTLDNKSGASYKGAALKLMAGDVHRVTEPQAFLQSAVAEAAPDRAVAPQFQEKAFAEYHLYTLQGKTDVNDKQTKQLSLFNASDVPCKKLFIYEPEVGAYYFDGQPAGDPQKVKVKVEVENKEANHLGLPMPKGKVRVYKKDDDGSLQFIGEDLIKHTPRDEKVRLYIGDAFDVVGEHIQTNYMRISDRVERKEFQIKLRNHKDTAVTVTAIEHAFGQWKILSSSMPYTKKDATTFEFAVSVPANKEAIVTYAIESKY